CSSDLSPRDPLSARQGWGPRDPALPSVKWVAGRSPAGSRASQSAFSAGPSPAGSSCPPTRTTSNPPPSAPASWCCSATRESAKPPSAAHLDRRKSAHGFPALLRQPSAGAPRDPLLLAPQVARDLGEFAEGRLQVFGDLGGEHASPCPARNANRTAG